MTEEIIVKQSELADFVRDALSTISYLRHFQVCDGTMYGGCVEVRWYSESCSHWCRFKLEENGETIDESGDKISLKWLSKAKKEIESIVVKRMVTSMRSELRLVKFYEFLKQMYPEVEI